jgi:hypothetical protein
MEDTDRDPPPPPREANPSKPPEKNGPGFPLSALKAQRSPPIRGPIFSPPIFLPVSLPQRPKFPPPFVPIRAIRGSNLSTLNLSTNLIPSTFSPSAAILPLRCPSIQRSLPIRGSPFFCPPSFCQSHSLNVQSSPPIRDLRAIRGPKYFYPQS